MDKKITIIVLVLVTAVAGMGLFPRVSFSKKDDRGAHVEKEEIDHHASSVQKINSEDLMSLVGDAARLVEKKGEKAFAKFAVEGSKWTQGESYIFVVDLDGAFVVHPDPKLSGKNQLHLKDVNGKPIVKWFLSELSGKDKSGWSHYLWAKPGEIFPSWKTTYLQLAQTPSGRKYIVVSGAYDLKTEKVFVVDGVNDAAELLKTKGTAAFSVFRDKASEFIYKDAYVFVLDNKGTLLVNPPFPGLEGQNLYNYKDSGGKYLFREFIETVNTRGTGWVEYLWPHPGEDEPHEKISFVKKVAHGRDVFIVGTGMYHAEPEHEAADSEAIVDNATEK